MAGVTLAICGGCGSTIVKIGPVVDAWPPRSVTVMLVLPSGQIGDAHDVRAGEVERTVAGDGVEGDRVIEAEARAADRDRLSGRADQRIDTGDDRRRFRGAGVREGVGERCVGGARAAENQRNRRRDRHARAWRRSSRSAR